MTDRVPASGTVHWVGAGLSTGSGLAALCATAGRVLLWHHTTDRAADALARRGLTGRAEPRALAPDVLAAALEPGDVVVSMLPAARHAGLLAACVRAGAHFACSSYAAPDLLAHTDAARAAGLTVLTETGLDPGVDHLFAHSLIGRARARIGAHTPASYRLTSYCGGIPAVPDGFRYRFSWAPLGVLNALRSPARYLQDGTETTVGRPWEATRPLVLAGERFEAYPNRDSVPFIARYDLPAAWIPHTFVRGTLRPDGWREAWEPVFAELTEGDDERIAALARKLAAAYPATEADRDRVVLSVRLEVDAGRGGVWTGAYLLDLTGGTEESAMARCVSRPLALGVRHILDGSLPAGLHRAAETPQRADRWLAELVDDGLEFTLTLGQ
ncbi:saccharopine dehydrogenase family protein [Streptomyces sp. NPDC006658]|uniref:saccharopine dehydrogenase family protein n=1 Tax=Streptomyces sp. NPDC006658 TaxID=3156900 RepID=UPI0033C55EF3